MNNFFSSDSQEKLNKLFQPEYILVGKKKLLLMPPGKQKLLIKNIEIRILTETEADIYFIFYKTKQYHNLIKTYSCSKKDLRTFQEIINLAYHCFECKLQYYNDNTFKSLYEQLTPFIGKNVWVFIQYKLFKTNNKILRGPTLKYISKDFSKTIFNYNLHFKNSIDEQTK